jgi:predicted nucleotide-binding protein
VATSRLKLAKPLDAADQLLGELVEFGNALLDDGRAVETSSAADEWKHKYDRWRRLTAEGLRTVFVGDAAADEFESDSRLHSYSVYDTPLEFHQRYLKATAKGVNCLVSLRERLTFAEAPEQPPGPTPATGRGTDVFVVHGRDNETKQEVARFLEQIVKPRVILLGEQPDQGRTIIEKFEDYASDVGFAVVLLTGDDEGRISGREEPLRARARQNVILELGFFIGTLGRGHVALLYEDGVELPSDITGVLYLGLDPEGAWKKKLALELSAAGVSIDLQATLRA